MRLVGRKKTCEGVDIQSIPESVCKLKFLKYFYISRNRLTGKLPKCVDKLVELIQWHTDCNKLTGEIPIGFKELPKFTELHTFCNNHTPACPPWASTIIDRGVIFPCENVDCEERCRRSMKK
ncbi:hypothetical protein GEMRC1_003975 [Eukaryota sp. GEM-RC1]